MARRMRLPSRRWMAGLVLACLACATFVSSARAKGPAERPDVLMIIADDLNDWIRILDERAPIATPNLQRLAQRGVSFTQAQCASPACNPSRTAVFTGRMPSSTGVYGNRSDWRGALPDAVTLQQHFMANGYRSEGAGKVFHHHDAGAFHDEASFDRFLPMPWPPDAPMPKAKLNGLSEFGTANTDWGEWPAHEADALDVRSVDWCIERLREPRRQPLMLTCGLFRPHMPFFVPARWLRLYPSEKTVMPTVAADDLADVPSGGRALMAHAARFFTGMMAAEQTHPGSWREAVRCYQAAATFADAQVGRLLDALDASPHAGRTIIVFWSDNGYQLGEKQCWEKFTLWEKATHVPLIVAAPGVSKPGTRCEHPVSLVNLYPTLIDLCGLPPRSELEGVSLTPLLRDPAMRWERPAVMTYERGNHAVRTARWRYIRYVDGTEELYDRDRDPLEHDNLASRAESGPILASLRRWLPSTDAPPVPDMKAPKKEKKGKKES